MPLACGTITVLAEKGQNRVSAIRKAFQAPSYALSPGSARRSVPRRGATEIPDPGAMAASLHSYKLGLPEWFVLPSPPALLKRDRSEEPYQA